MAVNIYSKRLGINRCYVINDRGCVMIDAGPPRSGHAIEDWFREIPISPDEIQLIVLTHGHFDHVGSARDIKEITGARIVVHHADKERVENALLIWPPAVTSWGSVVRAAFKPLTPLLFRFPPTKVDIVMEDEELSLAEYGIPGRVIHTPGHTAGSVSILLETGEAFVGCMAHNNPPFRLSPGLPIFAEELPKIKESWRKLLEQGAEMIYPAHGEPFSVDVIRKIL